MITNEIIESYINCKHKAILKLRTKQGRVFEYDDFIEDTKLNRFK